MNELKYLIVFDAPVYTITLKADLYELITVRVDDLCCFLMVFVNGTDTRDGQVDHLDGGCWAHENKQESIKKSSAIALMESIGKLNLVKSDIA